MKQKFIILLILLFLPLANLFGETPYQFHLGAEAGELANSKMDKFGANNYSVLFGQRFSSENFSNFGWRFSSFDVLLKDKHLDDIIFVKGNTNGIEARQSVQRLYADYYFKGWDFSFLKIIPIVSVGIGHSLISYQSPRSSYIEYYFLKENFFLYKGLAEKDSLLATIYADTINREASIYNLIGYQYLDTKERVTYTSPNIGASSRFQFLFFDLFFVEFQFDIARQTRRRKQWVTDTYLNFPEKTIAFTWINIGCMIKF